MQRYDEYTSRVAQDRRWKVRHNIMFMHGDSFLNAVSNDHQEAIEIDEIVYGPSRKVSSVVTKHSITLILKSGVSMQVYFSDEESLDSAYNTITAAFLENKEVWHNTNTFIVLNEVAFVSKNPK